MPSAFNTAADAFATAVKAAFAIAVPAQPEDQLKGPTSTLLRDAGAAFGYTVAAVTETLVAGLGGRPDMGVTVGGLLTGHVELKAPGRGARPDKFTGHDRRQWQKFRSLPNLIYTDGSDWSLYRTGDFVQRVTLPGDITTQGISAFGAHDQDGLARLLRDFFMWQPIVPSSPPALANVLAPLCRLLRHDVLLTLDNSSSAISQLAGEWRGLLFPEADNSQFADAYAQTVTYALLLAHLEGASSLSASDAVTMLNRGHGLLAQALRVLDDPEAEKEIGLGISLLRRAIAAVDVGALSSHGADPWLYFYEDFLAAYDPKLRKDRGVYYTPVQVVKTQITLVSELLDKAFGKPLAFADDDVVLLDPAVGTGTYPLMALAWGADRVRSRYGDGAVPGRADVMARNVHAFEILVGPYAVAHLRLTQLLRLLGAKLPADDVKVYLTDTLESPTAVSTFTATLLHRRLNEEHQRAQYVKASTRVLVCMGNPPYDRQMIPREEADDTARKGGWVRFADRHPGDRPILEDFLEPARRSGLGVHLKNLYNDYIYFWRWALWKVFDSTEGAGIVSFITASSYLRGPGFVGVRQAMRATFDELWIIDLEGDSLGPHKTENVFAIQTPVAIAIGVRYGAPDPTTAARAHYTRVTGDREAKLKVLHAVNGFASLTWRECFDGWMNPLLPQGHGDYYSWPKLTDVFPWHQSGVKVGRTWPIAPAEEVLVSRWTKLVGSTATARQALFKDSPTGRKFNWVPNTGGGSIRNAPPTAPSPPRRRFAFRSFDRQWLLDDLRLIDRHSPSLHAVSGPKQIFLTSLVTTVLGVGPAATATAYLPDLHHFRGSFGGADVIPLWRDSAGTTPNVTAGLLDTLRATYGFTVTPGDLCAYCYAIMSCPDYVDRFSEELTVPGPRIPITSDGVLFTQACEPGKRLLWLHTFGQRFVPPGEHLGRVPPGIAGSTVAVPNHPGGYPNDFEYEPSSQTLRVGTGRFAPVTSEVWHFSVSGLPIVSSWLAYRMSDPAGKSSSALDTIHPQRWTAQFTEELLEIIWVLEHTITMSPLLSKVMNEIVSGPTLGEGDLPQPTAAERQAPTAGVQPSLAI